MNLGDVLRDTLGTCSSWEQAIERMSARAQTRTPIKEDLLREICNGADPSFAAYFDRQRERARAARGAAERMTVDDPGDPYAEVDGMEEHP